MVARRWWAVLIAVVLAVGAIISNIVTSVKSSDFEYVFGNDREPFSEIIKEQGSSNGKIAVIHLEGTIMDSGSDFLGYNHQKFLEKLDYVKEDDQVKGVVLHVNSPGGGVVESDEIHNKVKELQKAGKKVYASMGNTAASGGYYVSAPADKIYAQPGTLTGSIGVIIQSINITKLADELGIDTNTFTSGEHKDILSSTREMTESEKDIIQSMVDEMYEDFVAVVADGRDMSTKQVKTLADGRVYTGKQALEHKLIDELGSLDDSIDALAKDIDVKNPQIVEYEENTGFMTRIGKPLQGMFQQDKDMEKLLETLSNSDGPRAMYLYSK